MSHSHYLHALLSKQPQISSAASPHLLLDKWHPGEKSYSSLKVWNRSENEIVKGRRSRYDQLQLSSSSVQATNFVILYDMDCSPFQSQLGNQPQFPPVESQNSWANSKAPLCPALAPNPDFFAGINPWLWLQGHQCPQWECGTPWCQPIPPQGPRRESNPCLWHLLQPNPAHRAGQGRVPGEQSSKPSLSS